MEELRNKQKRGVGLKVTVSLLPVDYAVDYLFWDLITIIQNIQNCASESGDSAANLFFILKEKLFQTGKTFYAHVKTNFLVFACN